MTLDELKSSSDYTLEVLLDDHCVLTDLIVNLDDAVYSLWPRSGKFEYILQFPISSRDAQSFHVNGSKSFSTKICLIVYGRKRIF